MYTSHNNQSSNLAQKIFHYRDDLKLSVFPAHKAKKTPLVEWKHFQYHRPYRKDIQLWLNLNIEFNLCVAGGLASENLAVLDCEYEEIFHEMIYKFKKAGFQTWTILSGGKKGGGHIYFRLPFPAAGKNYKESGKVLIELKGHGQQVISEGSLHPDGREYRTLFNHEKIVHIDDVRKLDFLNKFFPVLSKELEVIHDKPSGFSETAFLKLTGLDRPKSFRETDRSAHEFGIVLSCVGRGLDFHSVLSSFITHAYPGSKFSQLYQESQENGIRWLQQSYNNANTINSKKRSRVIETLKDLKEKVSQITFTGSTKHTDKVVLLTFIEKGIESNSNLVSASIRHLAEQAGINKTTLYKSVKRLIQTGWLVEKKRSNSLSLLPSEYEIQFGLFQNEALKNFENKNIQIPKLNDDVFAHKGLGKTGLEIYTLILNSINGISLKEILEMGKESFARRTVHRKITTMLEIGMINKKNGLFRINEFPDMKKLASYLGTLGLNARRKHGHKLETRAHKKNLETLQEFCPNLFETIENTPE